MAVRAVEFPLELSKLTSNPTFNTDVIVGANGREVRNANWQDGLWKFNAALGIKNRADAYLLYTFFLNCRGRETSFLLTDKNDFAIPQSGSTAQNIGTGDGSTTTFQITKKYVDSIGTTYTRNITRPSATTSDLVVYKNGVLQTHTTHYTYSTTTGIITFVSAPTAGHAITITLAKFYVPCRFESDELPLDMILYWLDNGSPYSQSEMPEIGLVEERY